MNSHEGLERDGGIFAVQQKGKTSIKMKKYVWEILVFLGLLLGGASGADAAHVPNMIWITSDEQGSLWMDAASIGRKGDIASVILLVKIPETGESFRAIYQYTRQKTVRRIALQAGRTWQWASPNTPFGHSVRGPQMM